MAQGQLRDPGHHGSVRLPLDLTHPVRSGPTSLSSLSKTRPLQAVDQHDISKITGEGVALTNAKAWHEAGHLGSGIRVAVFDGGFAGYQKAQERGEVPRPAGTLDLCEENTWSSFSHGTAVTEILHEMAPKTSVYLVCVTDKTFPTAYQWAKAQEVDLITVSMGWPFFPGDGTLIENSPDDIASQARSDGILWVAAAGNERRSHWGNTFTDEDQNSWHEFAPNDEKNFITLLPNGVLICDLRWNSWPLSSNDYDLYLYDHLDKIVASSSRQQSGNLPPTEQIVYANISFLPRKFYLKIKGVETQDAPHMDMFAAGTSLQHGNSSGSVLSPGTSFGSLTVGAVHAHTNLLEPFSSEGPTLDGRQKPEIVAPSSVSTSTFGLFSGTSASAPHAAGAAALYLSAYPEANAEEAREYILSNAQDLGPPGPDNQYGYGALWLPSPPAP